MKKITAMLLVLTICLGLCACGGSAAAEPATEVTTEPISDITVYAKVPRDWNGIGCWAWLEGGDDAFEAWPGEAMSLSGGWYSITVPGWIDSVIINGNDGSVQTADLRVEPGKDVWICVESAEDSTVHYQEPIPDITVYAKVPEDWNGIGCWAWLEGGDDAFEAWPGEAMSLSNGWYSISVPGWIDSVIINGNDGSVQTADLMVEAGEDVWVHVVNPEYAVVHYEEPLQEQLQEELQKPAKDYSENFAHVIARGNYQVAGTKVVTYHQRLKQYSTDYVPEELQTNNPQEVYYVIFLKNRDQSVGYYMGLGGMKSAIKPGIQVQIKVVGSNKVLAESKVFEGTEPPETISSDHNGRGSEPSPALIEAWIQENLPKVMENPPKEMPFVEPNLDALSEEERAVVEIEERAWRLGHSYSSALEWLVEYEGFTQESAEAALANITIDWKGIALQKAKGMLENNSWTYDELVEYMVDILLFTQEEAVYAADNCGADWNAQKMAVVQEILDNQPNAYEGYYSYVKLVDFLVKAKGFTKAEATAAADNCGLDWKEQAKLQAQWLVDDENGMGYSERSLGAYLRSSISVYGCGFTRDEAAYAMEHVKANWKEEAAKRAAIIVKYSETSVTKDEVLTDLTRNEGFSLEEANYAVEKNGLK